MIKKAAKKRPEGAALKKTGSAKRNLKFSAAQVEQGDHSVYVFKAKASVLYDALSINRRIESKDEGYQRVLSVSRVQAITRHLVDKKPIPTAIIVSFDDAKFSKAKNEIQVPKGSDVGWVIDGQHRLAGAAMAAREGIDIELPVVAFIGLTPERQVEQFVTINREAKNVPTSLYLDLLRKLPNKKPADIARERAVDIATELRRTEGSPFFEKIAVTAAPKQGQISLANFVRKVSSLVAPEKGILSFYSEQEQVAIVWNYYEGLRQVFTSEYEADDSIFFKTVGFGALFNVLPTFFSLVLRLHQGFEVKDVVSVFRRISNPNFSSWKELGTGSQAENLAGEDFKTSLLLEFNTEARGSRSLRV
ncbi:MAG TPA: DGQHR domain-containing protein [Pyrinomonadaceae bacterium]|nr:DGQHR domain-containing protein [Pyrinomonadaceae bacterium]